MDVLSCLGELFIIVFVVTAAIASALLIVAVLATGISDLISALLNKYRIWRNTRRWN